MNKKEKEAPKDIEVSKEMEIEKKLGFKFRTKIKIFEMVATILDKALIENYQGKYAGKWFFTLTVKIQTPQYSHINKIFCSPEKVNKQQIIEDIRDSKWVDRKYVFKTTRTSRFYANSYWLIDWEEVKPSEWEEK